MAAGMTVAEMSADMIGQSEKIGVQTVRLEGLLTVLKVRKNALHPDGTRLLTSEEALREPESSVGLDVKVLISEYWSAYYALAELGENQGQDGCPIPGAADGRSGHEDGAGERREESRRSPQTRSRRR